MQKTTYIKKSEITRKWYLIDASNKVLGRIATEIASLLIGKKKVELTNGVDVGDYVVVINASKIELTRGKETKKMYYSHTTHPGGFKEIRYDKLTSIDQTAPLLMAVTKMIPKNKLRDNVLARLHIYADENHKHEAQQPVKL